MTYEYDIFPDIGRNPILLLFIKKVIDRSLIIIDQFLFHQFVMKFLKNCHFLDGNNLFSPNQSGFRPSDFSEYQLISIVHHIYASFDCCHCCPSLEVTQKDFLGLCNTFKGFIQ